ncbi:MAG TPA: hypothetical protein VFZ65_06060 [Planctomycetota bacterium]|nr:hypothetical protein [Planctomycetota bacterium]
MRLSIGSPFAAGMALALAAGAAAQNCVWVASGCGCLLATRPACVNAVPAGQIGAGNPAFALRAEIFNACVPANLPLVLVLGSPGPVATIPPPLLDPSYGLPCTLGMPTIAMAAYGGTTHAFDNPAIPVPVPPGLAGLGHVLTAQMVILGPNGAGLSDSSGILL